MFKFVAIRYKSFRTYRGMMGTSALVSSCISHNRRVLLVPNTTRDIHTPPLQTDWFVNLQVISSFLVAQFGRVRFTARYTGLIQHKENFCVISLLMILLEVKSIDVAFHANFT